MIALNELSWSKLGFGYSAGTNSSEVVFVVNTLSAAEFLVAILLPFCNQISVSPLFIETVLVEVFANFLGLEASTFFL